MIEVLIVDSSPENREALRGIIEADPELKVAGSLESGRQAVEFAESSKPDLILMNIHLSDINGIQATRVIMEHHPVPIIITSNSASPVEVDTTFQAIQAGALTFMESPANKAPANHDEHANQLIKNIKALSEVKVLPRKPTQDLTMRVDSSKYRVSTRIETPRKLEIMAIGAATGGPPALGLLLANLPDELNIPVVVVQQLSSGFLEGMVDWIKEITGRDMLIAQDGMNLEPGMIYFGPDGMHMGVNQAGFLELSDSKPEHGVRPAVSYLFRSVARTYKEKAIGVLLTGLGADGAVELKFMKDLGAITYAQDKESAVAYGMPGVAAQLGGVTYIMSPEKIAIHVSKWLERQNV